jgi:hypothetical protein
MTAAVLSAAGVLCGKKCRKMVKNIRKMALFWTCRIGRIVLRKRYDNDIFAFSRIARLSV